MRRFVSVFVPIFMFVSAANADPQMLGVVTTASAVPLHCSGETCSAELTSICLHEQRPTPIAGHPYTPHNPDALRVTGHRADGSEIALDPTRALNFTAARGFTAMRVSAPSDLLEALKIASISVRVAEPLTLTPEQRGTETSRPLTETEIELGAGPMRATAAAIVDSDDDTMHASQAIARMIDALPHSGRASEKQRTSVWQSAVRPDVAKLSPTGVHRARTAYNRCYRQTRIGDKLLRGCLAEAHDNFVRDLNVEYWDAMKAGS